MIEQKLTADHHLFLNFQKLLARKTAGSRREMAPDRTHAHIVHQGGGVELFSQFHHWAITLLLMNAEVIDRDR